MTGRILIADGVPTNRIVLRVKLTSAFYDVQQASSGAEALALIRQERPDLVIASADLPDMEAEAFCSALQASASAAASAAASLPWAAAAAAADLANGETRRPCLPLE